MKQNRRSLTLFLDNGKAARQRKIVQGRITNGTLFPNISLHIKTDVLALSEVIFTDIQQTCDAHLDTLTKDLDMLLNSAWIDDDSRNELRDMLANLKMLVEEDLEEIQSVVSSLV